MNTRPSRFIIWLALTVGAALALTPLAESQVLAAATGDPITAESFKDFDIDSATLDDVIETFGEPLKFVWGRTEYSRDDLPEQFIADYSNDFSVLMSAGRVVELRHEAKDGYLFADKLQVSSTLEEVLAVLGKPQETVVGQPIGWRDGVLYKDADGEVGFCYYSKADRNVRLFFSNYRINALYETRSDDDMGPGSETKPKSVDEYDDVRSKDLSELDLSARTGLVGKLLFNERTIWPKKLPVGENPAEVLAAAMNPGLGVRELHKQGITGKGVYVAIIDQPLLQDHEEYEGKIVKYFDTGCQSETSMHGPSVASLLVGTKCGTAPDARLYYAAAPSWLADSAHYATALDWILEQNASLPPGQKIRAVSISAAPSGPGSSFKKNHDLWDEACRRAQDAGMLVLDCSQHNGFIGACWYDPNAPEDVARCVAGFVGMRHFSGDGSLLVPSSVRTSAEYMDVGERSYAYWGRGGLSWSIPYATGVLAMGWQLAPDFTAEEMKELLFESAYVDADGMKFIDPPKFIKAVREKLRTEQ